MCKKAMYAAIGKVESDLADDETIIWSGFPDRKIIHTKINTFYWKNVAFFIAILAGVVATLFIHPPQMNAVFGVLASLAAIRAIGAVFAWNNRKRRFNMAYALTNKRLISVNGTTDELASWYSPSIDSMRIKKCKNTSSFFLRDTELRFTMELYYISEFKRLNSLLTPYTPQGLDVRQDNKKIKTKKSALAPTIQTHGFKKAA